MTARPFVALAFLLVSCAGHETPCGAGTAVRIGGARVCAYEQDVVIVSGFDCPPGYVVRMDALGGTICADAWVDPDDPGVCDVVGGCDGWTLRLPPIDPDCEGLDPTHCLAPWPSDRWIDDTGAVAIPGEALPLVDGTPLDTGAWPRSDGFSTLTPIVVEIDGAIDATGLADEEHVALSVSDTSPTLVLDVTRTPATRVPHVAELDGWGAARRTTLWIRPLALAAGHRYVVAVRELRRPGGAPIAPALPFHALRDGVATDAPSIEARRAAFERDVLVPLAGEGIDRGSLHLAWTFHTASEAAASRDVSALAVSEAPNCSVASSVTDPDGWRYVRGTFESTRFLADDALDAPFSRDALGAPVAQGPARHAWVIAIPPGTVAPNRALLLGHALAGSAEEVVHRAEWRAFARARGAVLVATDLAGLASGDVAVMLGRIASDPAGLSVSADRALQGAHDLAALAASLPTCAADPALAPFVDPGAPHVVLLESTTMLAPALAAIGAPVEGIVSLGPWGSMAAWARRSSAARSLDEALSLAYPDPADRALALAALGTPLASLETVGRGQLPSTRLLSLSVTDSSRAPPLLARLWAASAALPLLAPSVEAPQLSVTVGAPSPRAWVAASSGLSRVALGSSPPPSDRMLEASLPFSPRIAALLDAFLRPAGEVTDACGGPCAL